MKRAILFLLLIPVGGLAQDYQMVRSDFVRLFKDDNAGHHGIKIDSVAVEGNDSLFFNYWHVRTRLEDGCKLLPNAPSFIGRKIIIQPTGLNLLFNADGDTIRINTLAAFNESWNLMNMGSDTYIKATVTQIQNQMVLDSLIEIKTIVLQLVDANDNLLPHPVNWSTLKISKTLGVISCPDLYYFPEEIRYYSIDGMEKPHRGVFRPSCGEDYQNAIGDEYHWKYSWAGPSGVSGGIESITKIVALETSWPLQSIYYHTIKLSHNNSSLPISTVLEDTVVVDLSQVPAPCSGPMPNEARLLISYWNWSNSVVVRYDSVFFDINSCGRPYSVHYQDLNLSYESDTSSGMSCYRPVIYGGGSQDTDSTFTYGLELTRRSTYVWYPTNWSDRNLVYYKRGTEECGVPFLEENLLSVDELGKQIPIAYPNPIQRGNQLNLGAYFESIDVLDMSGKVVLSKQQSATLETNELKAGVYLIRLQTDDRLSTQKLMVTD